jgi:hypothetical protein
MSYLDIEHFLQLRGSDHWSKEGNESQIMMRRAIGEIIYGRTPSIDDLPDIYCEFASRLSFNDTVITFNYDVVLERALEKVGKPYRLFPQRYKKLGRHLHTVDSSIEEVTVLKLHGSVDWFNDRHFLEIKASLEKEGSPTDNLHTVFDNPHRYGATPIVSGPRPDDDPLLHIHRLRESTRYYAHDRGFNAPFILSPSHVKFVYAEPLVNFWRGLGKAGGWNLGISVVGFSLPEHDEYIRVGLYQMITNYQQYAWDDIMLDQLKDYLRFVDFRNDEAAIKSFHEHYSFVDRDKARYMFDGFSDAAIQFLFSNPREA